MTRGDPSSPIRELASRGLAEVLGVDDPATLAEIAAALRPRAVHGGELLCVQGTPSDELYFVVSGRMQVYVDLGTPHARLVGEVVRGETVGEMGVIASVPRSATVRAVRDCEVLALSRAELEALIQRHPTVALALARQVVLRLQRSNQPSVDRKRPMCIAVATAGMTEADAMAFAQRLAHALRRFGSVRMASRPEARAVLGEEAGSDASLGGSLAGSQWGLALSQWLDDLEAEHEWLVLAGGDASSAWGRECLRQADETLWLAHADGESQSMQSAMALDAGQVGLGVNRRLVLLHPADRRFATGTAAWWSTSVDEVTHLREGNAGDVARLARALAGQSVGVTFSGGGARGFAHLGVYRALHEAGLPIDAVAGTSMGAGVGSFVALDIPPHEAIEQFRGIFRARPTGDVNILPLVSLVAGRRLKRQLERAYRVSRRQPLHLEDCWKPFHCIVADFSNSRMSSYRRGHMATLVRASMSLPGYLPPVFHENRALVDGGVFNNLPTDVMRSAGVRHVLAVDLRLDNFGPAPNVGVPRLWTTLNNWWSLRGARAGTARIPSMRELLFRLPTLHSSSHQQAAAEMADVLFQPEVGDVGILDWGSLDRTVQRGYDHARRRIDAGALDDVLRLKD